MPRRHKVDAIETARAGFVDKESFVSLEGKLFLSGWDWQEQKRQVAKRDNYTCQVCERAMDVFDGMTIGDVHHIIHRSKGGSDDLDNLMLVHRRCHEVLHEEKQTQFTREKI